VRTVQVKPGLKSVLLPDGASYDGGALVILSDEQYAKLSLSAKTNVLTDVGGTAGPITIGATAPAGGEALAFDAASQTYKPKSINRAISRIFFAGHSLMGHGGASSPAFGFGNRLTAMFGAQDINVARGGAVLGWSDTAVENFGNAPFPVAGTTGDGGYATFLQGFPYSHRGTVWIGPWSGASTYAIGDGVFTGSGAAARFWVAKAVTTNNDPTSSPTQWLEITSPDQVGADNYSATPIFPIISYGLNDLGWGKELPVFLSVLRVVMARLRAAKVWEDATNLGAGMLVYTGASWGVVGPATQFNSGGSYKAMNGLAVGAKVEAMIPPDWPGGKVRFGWLQNDQQPRGTGKVMLTMDGVDVREIDFTGPRTYTQSSDVYSDIVGFQEAVDVPSGKHIVGFRCTQAFPNPGGVSFDYVSLDSPTPGPSVFIGLHKPTTYSAYTNPLPTDTDVDVWNAGIKAMLAAEFPEVIFVEPTVLNPSSGKVKLYAPDGLHPNNEGHALVAEQVRKAVLAAPVTDAQWARQAIEERSGSSSFFAKYGLNAGQYTPPLAPALGAWGLVICGTKTVEGYVEALPGDLIDIEVLGCWAAHATALGQMDFAILARGQWVSYVSSGGATQAGNGIIGPGLSTGATVFPSLMAGPAHYIVRPEDIVNGVVTFQMVAACVTAQKAILATSPNNILDLFIENRGPADALRANYVV
jgi:hypothetical protein